MSGGSGFAKQALSSHAAEVAALKREITERDAEHHAEIDALSRVLDEHDGECKRMRSEAVERDKEMAEKSQIVVLQQAELTQCHEHISNLEQRLDQQGSLAREHEAAAAAADKTLASLQLDIETAHAEVTPPPPPPPPLPPPGAPPPPPPPPPSPNNPAAAAHRQ